MKNCTRGQYLESLDGVPMPSREQRRNLVDFVATAHSWYKAPVWPPTITFYFFLDKYAGFSDYRVLDAGKTIVPTERTTGEADPTLMPTTDYRRRFGHLDHTRDYPYPYVIETSIVRSKGRETILRAAERRGLPPEISELGRVTVSGVISPLNIPNPAFLQGRPGTVPDWPDESGGPAALAAIYLHCSARLESGGGGADPDLEPLVAPERKRQLAEMAKAIDRVCEFIESARSDPKTS